MVNVSWPRLIASILLCQAAGVLGSIATTPNIQGWYVNLNKPWFTPPNWLFGPVWISLYTLMGIALYLALEKGLLKDKPALGIFIAQLSLNSLWSFLFFGLESPLLGLAGIIPLWISIALNIWAFWKIDKRAGYLLVPYITWVSIATALNYYVWILNP